MLWWLLATSSVPLHLMYNSAVFTTLKSQSYAIFLAPMDITQRPLQQWSGAGPHWFNAAPFNGSIDLSAYERLENADCIRAYSKTYQAIHRNVVLITHNRTFGTPAESISWSNYNECGVVQPYCWICSFPDSSACNFQHEISAAGNWTLNIARSSVASWAGSQQNRYIVDDDDDNQSIDHCLSEQVSEQCQLHFSLPILIVVIICNLIKAFCMLQTLGIGGVTAFSDIGRHYCLVSRQA